MKQTTITCVILSDDSIPDRMDVAHIIHECDNGNYVLYVTEWYEDDLTPRQMAHKLLAAGSDPSFFDLKFETGDLK